MTTLTLCINDLPVFGQNEARTRDTLVAHEITDDSIKFGNVGRAWFVRFGGT